MFVCFSHAYTRTFSFEIVKDDSQAGFYVRSMLSTKSGGYTMEQNDTQGGLIGVYEMYTDRSNGIILLHRVAA